MTQANNNTALIPIFTIKVGVNIVNVCDARTLHSHLQVGKDFSTWIKDRIKTYGFIDGEDYTMIDSPSLGNQKGRGGDRKSRDFQLTLDTAKEMAMVEKNEQGKQIRRYFIQCERIALNQAFNSHLPPNVEKACDPVSFKHASQHQQQAMLLIGSAARTNDDELFWSMAFLIKKRLYQHLAKTAKALLAENRHEEFVINTILDWSQAKTSALINSLKAGRSSITGECDVCRNINRGK